MEIREYSQEKWNMIIEFLLLLGSFSMFTFFLLGLTIGIFLAMLFNYSDYFVLIYFTIFILFMYWIFKLSIKLLSTYKKLNKIK